MKIIDLLIKIARKDDDLPKHIKIKGQEFKLNNAREGITYLNENHNTLKSAFNMYYFERILNDEVEILEDKPEKIEQIMTKKAKYKDINELALEVFKAFEIIDELSIAVNYLLEKSDKE